MPSRVKQLPRPGTEPEELFLLPPVCLGTIPSLAERPELPWAGPAAQRRGASVALVLAAHAPSAAATITITCGLDRLLLLLLLLEVLLLVLVRMVVLLVNGVRVLVLRVLAGRQAVLARGGRRRRRLVPAVVHELGEQVLAA